MSGQELGHDLSMFDHSSNTPLISYHFADDDSNTVVVESDQGPVLTKTTWTLLLYLTSATDGCQGGETVFFPNDRQVAKEEVAVLPETGMLLLHKHGDDCMLVGLPSSPASMSLVYASLPVKTAC